MSSYYGKIDELWVKKIKNKSVDLEIRLTTKRMDAKVLNTEECNLVLEHLNSAKIVKMDIKETDVTDFVQGF